MAVKEKICPQIGFWRENPLCGKFDRICPDPYLTEAMCKPARIARELALRCGDPAATSKET